MAVGILVGSLGALVAIAAILSFLVKWPSQAKRVMLIWLGHRPVAISSYQPPAPTTMPAKEPIPASLGFDATCARMAKVHAYNHASSARMVNLVSSKVRRNVLRGLNGAAVVPWDGLNLNANVATGENLAITVWMRDGSSWPEDLQKVRLILKGRTITGERVRWRGTVRLRRYGWSAPFVPEIL